MNEADCKIDARSVIGRLPEEQRETVHDWLFQMNLSVSEISRRLEAQFKVTLDPRNVAKYRRAHFQKYLRIKITEVSHRANQLVKEAAKNPTDYYLAIVTLLGQLVFEKALGATAGDDFKEIREALRVLIIARMEGHEASRVALEREKWEFDVSRICVMHLAELQVIIANDSVNEDARLQAIRKRLFGNQLPEMVKIAGPSENCEDETILT